MITDDWKYAFIAIGFAMVGYIVYNYRLPILIAALLIFFSGYWFRKIIEMDENRPM